MSRRILLIDAAIAALIAALILVLTPGLAMAAIVALLILLVCLVSFGVGWIRSGYRRRISGRGLPRYR